MSKYRLLTLPGFDRDVKKLRRDAKSTKALAGALKLMLADPFSVSLKTHQVSLSSLGTVWSSRVTGDLRLLWVFDEDDQLLIIAVRLQGHDTVYR